MAFSIAMPSVPLATAPGDMEGFAKVIEHRIAQLRMLSSSGPAESQPPRFQC
jgi:hypothetical protein